MSKSTMLPRALPVVLAVCLALGMFNCVAGQTLIDSTTHESSAGSQAAQDAATPPGDAGDATRDASAVEAVDMAANDTSRASNGSPASSHSNDKAPEAVQVVAEDDEKTPSSTSQNLTDPASKPPVAEGVRADDSIDSGFGSSDYPGIGYLPPSSTDTLDGTSLDTGTCRRYSLGSLSEDKGVEQPLEQRVCLDRASSFAMKEGGLVDAVFLGDDNIKRWVSDAPDTWKWMSSNVMKGSPANLGCDGMDSTGGLAAAWRLVEQTPLSPKAWVLSLGSNDCVDGGSYEAVASKLQDIIQVLRFYNCYSQVVVNAILPSTLGSDGHDWESSPHRTCIQNTNSAMKRFAAKNSHMGVSFVDCGSSFLSVRGNTIDRTKMPDGHHLSHTGYTTLAACLGKHLLPYSALERSKYPQSFDFSTQPKPSPASKPNKYDWSFSDWSSCTGACGSGMQTRTAFCADAASGQEVEESRCGERGSLTLLRQCSRPPCVFFSFVAGPWSECSKTCGTGTSKRNVTCMGSDGTHAADSACKGGASLAATKPSEETECNSQPCNSACGPGGGCSGNGMCSEKRDRCICRPGFKGTWCHVSADCSSGAASTSGCCPSGIVAADGSCAPTGAAIDLNGKVCASGSLDVCGVCDGNGASVDVFGQCCDGQLDAAGVCCRGNHKIDECGACSGSSSTCAVVAQVTHCTVSVCMPVSVSLTVSLSLSPSLSFLPFSSLPFSRGEARALSLSLSIYLSIYLSISIYLSLPHSLPLRLFVPSPSPLLYLSLCISLRLSICVSLCLCLCLTHTLRHTPLPSRLYPPMRVWQL